MDFTQRTSSSAAAPAPAHKAPAPNGRKTNRKWSGLLKWTSWVLLVSVTVLVLAVIASIALAKTHEEKKYVNTSQYQAVFVNGNQVYFGKISALNSKYVVLHDVYYLRVSQTIQPNQSSSTPSDVSLVKLGCELHGPEDQLVINDDQVVFWENLKTDGQVAKAIASFQKANPNGQTCNNPTTDSTKK